MAYAHGAKAAVRFASRPRRQGPRRMAMGMVGDRNDHEEDDEAGHQKEGGEGSTRRSEGEGRTEGPIYEESGPPKIRKRAVNYSPRVKRMSACGRSAPNGDAPRVHAGSSLLVQVARPVCLAGLSRLPPYGEPARPSLSTRPSRFLGRLHPRPDSSLRPGRDQGSLLPGRSSTVYSCCNSRRCRRPSS